MVKDLTEEGFEKTLWKKKKKLVTAFPLPQCFSTLIDHRENVILATFSLSSANAFLNLAMYKNLSFSKGLKLTTIFNKFHFKEFADDKLTHSHTMTPFDASGKLAF